MNLVHTLTNDAKKNQTKNVHEIRHLQNAERFFTQRLSSLHGGYVCI